MVAGSGDAGTSGATLATALTTGDLRAALEVLAAHDGVGLSQAEQVDQLTALEQLKSGEISEWRATLVARETAVLSREHRAVVDTELAGQLTGAGDKKVADLARAIGYRLDPGSAIRRVHGAEADRRVGLRPVAQGVACKAALTKDADAKRAAGDPRTRGQIMADTLVERITGQATADHITRSADGGRTTADNGQGLCEACNFVKERPGWNTTRIPDPDHVVETVTPTGHRHRTRAPDPPGTRTYPYRLEIQFARAA